MNPLRQRLLDHLESITGERPRLSSGHGDRLPLYLREHYEFVTAQLFGRRFVMALENEDWDTGSPGEYEKQSTALSSQLGEPVVLVLPVIPSYARNRMVRLGIPFIVPGSQLFLPMVMMDLRERFAQTKPKRGKALTPAAQCLVLYHLQKSPLEEIPLREIAPKIGYSPIMVTKAKDELEAAELCTTLRQGRAITLAFAAQGRKLWKQALPLLSSPIKKIHWIRWDQPAYPALKAGITALSRLTSISDDPIPTYALPSVTFQANLEKGTFTGCQGPEDATVRMEAWSYNPMRLGDSQMVDPLSLYLSLSDSADDRVQQQTEILIDQIKW